MKKMDIQIQGSLPVLLSQAENICIVSSNYYFLSQVSTLL